MPQVSDYSSLVQLGVAGVMLAWFMFRVERKMDDHTAVVSDLARSILLDVLSRDTLAEPLRREANDLLERVAERQRSLRPTPHGSVHVKR